MSLHPCRIQAHGPMWDRSSPRPPATRRWSRVRSHSGHYPSLRVARVQRRAQARAGPYGRPARHPSAGQPLERLESGVLTLCTSDTSLPGTFQHIQQRDISSGRASRRIRGRGVGIGTVRGPPIRVAAAGPEAQSQHPGRALQSKPPLPAGVAARRAIRLRASQDSRGRRSGCGVAARRRGCGPRTAAGHRIRADSASLNTRDPKPCRSPWRKT